jgi:hypothetical protein
VETRNLLERFAAQANDFERTFIDDAWSRLEQYFTVDAVYETLGEGGERFVGRPALLAALRRAVTNFDRRCDSRTLVTTDGPRQRCEEVCRTWSCRFTVSGAPDLIIEGYERALYRDDLIELLQETLTPASRANLNSWAATYGSKLAPR